MKFDSDKLIFECYKGHTTSIDFSVRKEYANKNRIQGFKSTKKKTKTRCLTHIIISSRQSNGLFHISSFIEKHNHPIADSFLANLLPGEPKLGVNRPKASFDYVVRQAGEQSFLVYTKRDHKKYPRSKRQENLKHELEDDSLMTNVFWIDAKMIKDFKIYGYYQSLALFVDLNNHREMVIFCATLLYEESSEYFVFRIMSTDKPQTFMIDQDTAIAFAVSLIMPLTYHRQCV
ncbi:hypothetical protein R3W88_029456 [Solanum pinnatisectum]|uniref:Protein FAR1-RELATED SEQUENCE n=1 Tax=Solanum pinnatisectum TaxID=50273 RepID=A0AAV9K5R6_9SOLN|nr:hypothetical protein R3W88_029456 [Solanum pinnatisectum]